MRAPRKLLLAAAAVLGVVLLLLVLLPLAFRGRIEARAQAEIERSVDARVRWSGVGLSLLRDFPNATLRLDDLSVVGVDRFEGDTLAAIDELRLVLDLGSVLRGLRGDGALVVREVALREPRLRLTVLDDGAASWDIVRERQNADPSDTSAALAVSLRDLAITGGDVRFDDRQSRLVASVAGLDVALSGDLAREELDLATRLRADALSVRLAGVPYLSGVVVSLDTDVHADMRAGRFTFDDDELRLNDLALRFTGSVAPGDSGTALDLAFSTPSTEFASILSLVPALYAEDFERMRTSGRMSVSGSVRGTYGPSDFPALAIRAQAQDGSFQHPDLPLPARDIALDLAIDNPGGHVDATVVTLSRLHLALGGRPLDARVVLRTPVSDPDVDLALKGSVQLADVQRTIPLEDVRELAGLVTADVALRTRRSWVDAGRYEQVSASGTIDVSRLAVAGAALPHPVAVDTARLRFTPQRIELATLTARAGNSDVRATGAIRDLLGFALLGEELQAEATIASDRIDLNEWRSDEAAEAVPVPPNVDLTLRATAREVRYGTLTLANARGGVRVKDRRATLDDVRVAMLGGEVVANGWYDTADSARPAFDLAVAVDSVDIPTAFASLVTVQRLAPIARHARGRVSANLDLAGTLGEDMAPVLAALTGEGAVRTAQVAIEGFPALVRLADALRIEQLRNPAVRDVDASVRIVDGRVHLRPFDVRVGEMALTVTGSNGMDQTLDYDLALAVPTSLLGADASRAIASLASRAGRVGLDLGDAQVVSIAVDVTGTVTDPTVRPAFGGTAGSIREGVRQAVQTEVESRVAEVGQRVDSAAEAARARARAEAERLVEEAEERAAAVKAEADTLAARLRQEADERATALVERATNPVARVAAQAAADRLRREADEQGQRLVREAGERADALVTEARRRADALVPPEP